MYKEKKQIGLHFKTKLLVTTYNVNGH